MHCYSLILLPLIIVLSSIMWRVQCGASIFKHHRKMLLRYPCRSREKTQVPLPIPLRASSFSTAAHSPPIIRGSGGISCSRPSSSRKLMASSLLYRSCCNHSSSEMAAPSSHNCSTLQTEGSSTPKEIFRADYSPPAFSIEHVKLSFLLDLDDTVVTSRSSIARSTDSTGDHSLVLDGKRERRRIC